MKPVVLTTMERTLRDDSSTDEGSEGETELPDPLTSLFDHTIKKDDNKVVMDNAHKVFLELSKEYSQVQFDMLEERTRRQRDTTLWAEHRVGRITSTTAHRVLHQCQESTRLNILNDIMQYGSTVKTTAMRWGMEKEVEAVRNYTTEQTKTHTDFKYTPAGIFVRSKYPHLSASPDGLVQCTCCGKGTLEVKCPYKYKDGLPSSNSDTRFCLDSNFSLKVTHEYYTQVQMHMFATNTLYCDFVVWTPNQIVVNRIYHDMEFELVAVPKLNKFFRDVILPEILTRSHCTSKSIVEEVYCICRRPSFGKMIPCHGNNCSGKWFHYSCVGIKKIPKKAWLCSKCSNATNK